MKNASVRATSTATPPPISHPVWCQRGQLCEVEADPLGGPSGHHVGLTMKLAGRIEYSIEVAQVAFQDTDGSVFPTALRLRVVDTVFVDSYTDAIMSTTEAQDLVKVLTGHLQLAAPIPEPAGPHLSVLEAARYMRRSRNHVYRLVASGELPSSMDGRRTIHRDDADRYLRSVRQVGTRA